MDINDNRIITLQIWLSTIYIDGQISSIYMRVDELHLTLESMRWELRSRGDIWWVRHPLIPHHINYYLQISDEQKSTGTFIHRIRR